MPETDKRKKVLPTVFYGSCSEKELIEFSLRAVKLIIRGKVPKESVAMPAPRKTRNMKRDGNTLDPHLNLVFRPIQRITTMNWTIGESGKKMKISFHRANGDIFDVVCKANFNCQQVLKKMGLKIK